jgi:hypothetical protein
MRRVVSVCGLCAVLATCGGGSDGPSTSPSPSVSSLRVAFQDILLVGRSAAATAATAGLGGNGSIEATLAQQAPTLRLEPGALPEPDGAEVLTFGDARCAPRYACAPQLRDHLRPEEQAREIRARRTGAVPDRPLI